jgi:hypothetical protein
MNNEQITNGLMQLGFNSGWAITDGEIILWENTEPQPSQTELLAASKLWDEDKVKQDAQKAADKAAAQAKLAALGLTQEEIAALSN